MRLLAHYQLSLPGPAAQHMCINTLRGERLEDGRTLASYGIAKGSTLRFYAYFRGG